MGEQEGAAWKKKKKKSFLQRAKKFGKSGRFGKGREIDKDTYDYFVRVLEQVNQGFQEDEDDPEAQEIFVANVFEQTNDQELVLAGNQLVSRVLERLLPIASHDVQSRFMSKLADDLRRAATDPFASHVLELLLLLATFQPPKKEDGKSTEAVLDFRRTWVIRLAKFMINNFDEFCFDRYASHLLRTCLQCLAGVKLDESVTRSRKSRDQKQNFSQLKTKDGSLDFLASKDGKSPPSFIHNENESCFQEPLVMAVDKVTTYGMAEDLIGQESPSGVVQTLLMVVGNKHFQTYHKKLVNFLMEKVYAKANLSAPEIEYDARQELLDFEPCCRTLEAMILSTSSRRKLYNKIADFVKEKGLLNFALHPIANFPLQKLLNACQDKEQFEAWYEEVFDKSLEEILASGNSGVVVSVCQACARLNAKQAHFLVAVMKALHCYEPSQYQEKTASFLIHLSTREAYEEADQESVPISLQGTLVLQEILKFNKPIKVVNSFLSIDEKCLSRILSDPKGSHITDAFMSSTTIGEKSRENLVKKLQGHLFDLATSKHGSRTMDTLWEKSSWRCREWIASELLRNEAQLNSNIFGKFLAKKMVLSTFKRSKDEWKKAIESGNSKTAMAKDFMKALNKKPIKKALDAECFAIDSVGEDNLLHQNGEESISPPKKKKKKAKSYLDDL